MSFIFSLISDSSSPRQSRTVLIAGCFCHSPFHQNSAITRMSLKNHLHTNSYAPSHIVNEQILWPPLDVCIILFHFPSQPFRRLCVSLRYPILLLTVFLPFFLFFRLLYTIYFCCMQFLIHPVQNKPYKVRKLHSFIFNI